VSKTQENENEKQPLAMAQQRRVIAQIPKMMQLYLYL
jgi:hypothetical protein